jgi:hypothetical protein
MKSAQDTFEGKWHRLPDAGINPCRDAARFRCGSAVTWM